MKRLFIINQDAFGHGDHERGEEAIDVFFLKLWPKDEKPDAILFFNSAVRMLARGSHHLPGLTGLADSGIDLLVCRESLEALGLSDELLIGRPVDMDEMTRVMFDAQKTITL